MLVMIDNYDSFTYNLVQYFGQLGEEVKVFRNDQVDLAGLEAAGPERIGGAAWGEEIAPAVAASRAAAVMQVAIFRPEMCVR